MTPKTYDNLDNSLIKAIFEKSRLTPSYLCLMATAGVLAAVAFLTDSVPMLIGAMVVAPALAPLSLTSFALVGGRPRLSLYGLWTIFAGMVVAVAFSVFVTWILNGTGVLPEEANLVNKALLEERVRPGWYSVLAAAAAGIAGTIATSKGKIDTLVGAVASLALVPAGSAGGIALVSGSFSRAYGGFVLLLVNMGIIIAMGIVTLTFFGKELSAASAVLEESARAR